MTAMEYVSLIEKHLYGRCAAKNSVTLPGRYDPITGYKAGLLSL